MAAKRKTVRVADIVQTANRMMAACPDDWTAQREGISSLLESVLHDSGQYRGFHYIVRGGQSARTADIHAGNYDDTRRAYYWTADRYGSPDGADR